jgi:hypothetical protein
MIGRATQILVNMMLLGAVGPSLAVYAQTYNPNSSQGNGIVNSGGQWAGQIGAIGAAANRKAADQLLQQSLAHEAQGFSSFPPNFGLLSQSLTEARQGIKADDQARHLAQTSLEALKTGDTAGTVDLQKYGTSESDLKDLANNSSKFLPQVQSDMGKYGISVDHDGSVIQTPFGKFSLDLSGPELASAINKGAGYFGANAQALGAAVQSALAESESIAKKALAEAQANANKRAGAAGDSSVAGGASGDATKDGKPSKEAAAGGRQPTSLTGEPKSKEEFDINARELELAKSRAALQGLTGTTSAIGDGSLGLFAIVHQRYEQMKIFGRFNSSH